MTDVGDICKSSKRRCWAARVILRLRPAHRYFPIEQFVFVAFEDMENNADGIQANVNALTDHIGIERISIFDEQNRAHISNQNNKGKESQMSVQLLRALQQFFKVFFNVLAWTKNTKLLVLVNCPCFEVTQFDLYAMLVRLNSHTMNVVTPWLAEISDGKLKSISS